MKSYGGVGLTTITWPTVPPAGPASAQRSSYLPRVDSNLRSCFTHMGNGVRVACCASAVDSSFTHHPQRRSWKQAWKG